MLPDTEPELPLITCACAKLSLATVGGSTVKEFVLTAVAVGVTMLIGPEVAPVGTTAVTWVEEFAVKLEALVPLNLTADARLRLTPVITTEAPGAPLDGLKLLIDGATAAVPARVAMSTAVLGTPMPVTRSYPAPAV